MKEDLEDVQRVSREIHRAISQHKIQMKVVEEQQRAAAEMKDGPLQLDSTSSSSAHLSSPHAYSERTCLLTSRKRDEAQPVDGDAFVSSPHCVS